MRRCNKGFTLVELILVIVILGVLALISVPKLTISKKTASITAHNANVKILENAASMYIADEGIPDTVVIWNPETGKKANSDTIVNDNDKWSIYLQEWPKVPEGIGYDNSNYKVTIDEKGNIIVEPGTEVPRPKENK